MGEFIGACLSFGLALGVVASLVFVIKGCKEQDHKQYIEKRAICFEKTQDKNCFPELSGGK